MFPNIKLEYEEGLKKYQQRYSLNINSGDNFRWNEIEVKATVRFNPSVEKVLPIRRTDPREKICFRSKVPKAIERYGICLGPGTNDVPWGVDPTNRLNVLTGYHKRLMPVMTTANRMMLYGNKKREFRGKMCFDEFVKKTINKYYKPLAHLEEQDVFNDWIEKQHNYNDARKQELKEAFDTIHVEGKRLNEKDYVVNTFIKPEWYEAPKCPRWIASRSDRFKAKVAGFIHRIEKQIYNTLIDGNKWFIKGEVISQLPKRIKAVLTKKFMLETDFSSFESGFNPFFTDCCECNLWRYFLVNNKTILDDVMKCYYQKSRIQVKTPKGMKPRYRECIKPRVEKLKCPYYTAYASGLRMSGEMWTSLGNGFSNLMIFLYIAYLKGKVIKGLVEGDDGIFGIDSKFVDAKIINEFGFSIKIQYETEMSKTCFCGNLFVEEEEKLIVAPEQIARFMWTCHRQYAFCGYKKQMQLLKAKAMSLYCTGQNTPIAAFLAYKTYMLLTSVKAVSDESHNWWKQEKLRQAKECLFVLPTITEKARLMYADKFKIPLSLQLMLENLIMKAKNVEELYLPYSFMSVNTHASGCCSYVHGGRYYKLK